MTALQVWARRGIAVWLLIQAGVLLVGFADELALHRHARRQARR